MLRHDMRSTSYRHTYGACDDALAHSRPARHGFDAVSIITLLDMR